MLDEKTIAIVKSTAPVLAEHGETLTKHFYKRMFSHNPEVAPFFNPAHRQSGTEFGRCAEHRFDALDRSGRTNPASTGHFASAGSGAMALWLLHQANPLPVQRLGRADNLCRANTPGSRYAAALGHMVWCRRKHCAGPRHVPYRKTVDRR